jgi:hypothetical protein
VPGTGKLRGAADGAAAHCGNAAAVTGGHRRQYTGDGAGIRQRDTNIIRRSEQERLASDTVAGCFATHASGTSRRTITERAATTAGHTFTQHASGTAGHTFTQHASGTADHNFSQHASGTAGHILTQHASGTAGRTTERSASTVGHSSPSTTNTCRNGAERLSCASVPTSAAADNVGRSNAERASGTSCHARAGTAGAGCAIVAEASACHSPGCKPASAGCGAGRSSRGAVNSGRGCANFAYRNGCRAGRRTSAGYDAGDRTTTRVAGAGQCSGPAFAKSAARCCAQE